MSLFCKLVPVQYQKCKYCLLVCVDFNSVLLSTSLLAEQFMFRRSNSRDPNLSTYMADRFGRVDEEDEEESEEEALASSQDYRRPQLDPTSEGIHNFLAHLCRDQTNNSCGLSHSNYEKEMQLTTLCMYIPAITLISDHLHEILFVKHIHIQMQLCRTFDRVR